MSGILAKHRVDDVWPAPLWLRLPKVPSVPKKAGHSHAAGEHLAQGSSQVMIDSCPQPGHLLATLDSKDLIDMFDWLEADESDSKVTFQASHRSEKTICLAALSLALTSSGGAPWSHDPGRAAERQDFASGWRAGGLTLDLGSLGSLGAPWPQVDSEVKQRFSRLQQQASRWLGVIRQNLKMQASQEDLTPVSAI